MLLIFGLLYLSRSAVHAAPASTFLGDSNFDLPSSSPAQCLCPGQQRSVWDIVWSCFATIFACSWVSVHPNMPAPNEKSWRISLRRLELMLWTIIAPEMIILWALRQWVGARNLALKYHANDWTKTHGYFIQMGGFSLYQGDELQGVLSPERLEELLLAGEIEFPTITEEEIQDRSKDNGLSKALVIGQTSWFVIQCIARQAQELEITELELVTTAFAALNGVMYFLWWNKPLDVRCSVPIRLLEVPNEPFKFEPPPIQVTPQDALFSFFRQVCAAFPSRVKAPRESFKDILKGIILSPLIATAAFFSQISDMFSCEAIEDGQVQVPTFYAVEISEAAVWAILVPIVGVVFGGIHCAGWSFMFPSHAELVLWRISSTIITGIPLFLSLHAACFLLDDYTSIPHVCTKIVESILVPVLFALPIYAIARLLLLVEALVALRALPLGAYGVVKWVTYLPHI